MPYEPNIYRNNLQYYNTNVRVKVNIAILHETNEPDTKIVNNMAITANAKE